MLVVRRLHLEGAGPPCADRLDTVARATDVHAAGIELETHGPVDVVVVHLTFQRRDPLARPAPQDPVPRPQV